MDEFAKFLTTLGVGGVLAAMMFWFYRKDQRQFTDLWKAQSELLMEVVKENTASNTKLIEQTAGMTKLIELVLHLVRQPPAHAHPAPPPAPEPLVRHDGGPR